MTVLPILIYASCVKRLPMTIMGFLQYLSPTLGIVCSYLMGETMGEKRIYPVWLYLDRSASLQHRYSNSPEKRKSAPPYRKRDSTSKTSRIAKIINRIPECFSGKRSPCSAAWSAFSCQRTSAAIDKAHVATTKIQKTISTYT